MLAYIHSSFKYEILGTVLSIFAVTAPQLAAKRLDPLRDMHGSRFRFIKHLETDCVSAKGSGLGLQFSSSTAYYPYVIVCLPIKQDVAGEPI